MNELRLTILSAIYTFVLVAAVFAESPDVAAALADRAKLPAEQWPSTYYLTLRPHTGQQRTDLERAIKLLVASDSPQPILERCVPVHVSETLLRINLDDLHWSAADWRVVSYTRNPYCPIGEQPLVIRADWLLSELGDLRESDSYNRMMFGGDRLPKTKGDVFNFFGVAENQFQTFGFIEGESGVSVQGTRLIQSLPIPRTWAWITSDVKKLDSKRDPLGTLGSFTPDGQEGIVGLFKQSLTTGQTCGLQWYWLNNAKGEIVAEAPADLVLANPHFRRAPVIAPPGACIQCHRGGGIAFTKDSVREFVKSGANIYANKVKGEQIEASLLTKFDSELRNAGEAFTLGVTLATGCAATDASKSFQDAINQYDLPLNLEQTAAELYSTPEEWTRTLAMTGTLPAPLAALPHGGTVPRASWEELYNASYAAAHGGGGIVVKQQQAVVPADSPALPKATQVRPQQRSGGRR